MCRFDWLVNAAAWSHAGNMVVVSLAWESVNAEFPDVGRSVRLSKVETVRYIGYSVV